MARRPPLQFDPKVIAEAIATLSPEEAMVFMAHMDGALKQRRLQLTGYVVAALLWAVSMAVALYLYGTAARGTFITWVFLVPFGILGGVMWMFGRLADKLADAGGAAGYGPPDASNPR